MTESITYSQWAESEGTDDWQWIFWGPTAHFRVDAVAGASPLVERIAQIAGEGDVQPDIDVRRDGVTVRLRDMHGVTQQHLDVAREISAAARALGLTSDPTRVETVQIAIDALEPEKVMPFWAAVLGHEEFGGEDVIDPQWRNFGIWFQQMDAARPQRNRIHIDVSVPPDQVEARVKAAVAAGGRVLSEHPPTWWTLADPEGNEVDVTSWLGRD
ncbi:MAG TPA: VOC family protein [Jatrophihabitantaceae bacterium]|nr:VOC family protein [Jatrophihabitantaceae bacterium]